MQPRWCHCAGARQGGTARPDRGAADPQPAGTHLRCQGEAVHLIRGPPLLSLGKYHEMHGGKLNVTKDIIKCQILSSNNSTGTILV
eukprot:scaffold212227_cov16-Prasinocladus_malaysianus.AAC.1